ncbi:MAG: hypothetical protein ABEJ93_01665 [Candidatus Nanohalobium sp.]
MKDPWKILAFPVATLVAHFTSAFTSGPFGGMTSLSPLMSEVAVVGATGLLVGFLVDEVIPWTWHKWRGGGSDLGGGDVGDLDLD